MKPQRSDVGGSESKLPSKQIPGSSADQSRHELLNEAQVAGFAQWLDRKLPELESRFESFTTALSLILALKKRSLKT